MLGISLIHQEQAWLLVVGWPHWARTKSESLIRGLVLDAEFDEESKSFRHVSELFSHSLGRYMCRGKPISHSCGFYD